MVKLKKILFIAVLLIVMFFLSIPCYADNSERILELQAEAQKIQQALQNYQNASQQLRNRLIGIVAVIEELERQDLAVKEEEEPKE